MSLVRGAKMVDVTLVTVWGLERKIFAVANWARALFTAGVDVGWSGSDLSKKLGLAKIAAVTDRGRRLKISQLFTLMIVFIGLMVMCPAMSTISFLPFDVPTITLFATLLLTPIAGFRSDFFCFKSLIPSTMLSRFTTFVSVIFVAVAVVSTTFDRSCCASSWAHDKISCSFSIPLQVHKKHCKFLTFPFVRKILRYLGESPNGKILFFHFSLYRTEKK